MAAEPRLGASGIRIAVMQKHLDDLEHDIEEAAKIDPIGFVREMHEKLDEYEGPACSNRLDLPCGYNSAECVSSLLLCDGVVDCHNGWDEEASTCDPGPIQAGNVFSGMATWHRCLARGSHTVSVRITATYRPEFFGARMGMRASVDMGERKFDAKGYYVFGKKTMVLVPMDMHQAPERMGVVCHFHANEHAHCHVVHQATLGECADFHATLQH
jgi:hypothetical protein